jgi:hypothetical protein
MKLKLRHYGIIVFTLATAFLHLAVYPDIAASDPIFLNGFGYLALLGMYFLPVPAFQNTPKLNWWALLLYTLLTIVLWIFLGNLDFGSTRTSIIGYFAKAAEVLLVICLWLDRPAGWNKREPKPAAR